MSDATPARDRAARGELTLKEPTKRQFIVFLASLELGNSEAATRLGLREATVHKYISSLEQRFGVHSKTELAVVLWKRYPWLRPLMLLPAQARTPLQYDRRIWQRRLSSE